MSIQEVEHIWHNGQLIRWQDAKVHVLTHALHYGTSLFEGIRVYDTPDGPMGFRVHDHMQRLVDSAKIYGISLDYDAEALTKACLETVAANNLRSAYIRPVAFLGYGSIGVAPLTLPPVEIYMAAFPWGAYLGDEGRTKGVDVCVSSWNRLAPNTAPTGAKAGGNYLSSFLISREAKLNGFAEGIGLDTEGRLSEGAGENIFAVKDGRILTPPAASSILQGITRDSIIKLARAEGIEVVEQALPREILYLADEIFFTGTAVELTPVRSVDRKPTRAAGPGDITKCLQDRFFGLFEGRTPDRWNWLEPVPATVSGKETDHGKRIAV